MNQLTTHTPGPFDKVRASAKKLGETADQMERLLNKTKSQQDRIRDAAPDLLEALTLLVAGIENSVSDTYIPLVKARAAITKATGK